MKTKIILIFSSLFLYFTYFKLPRFCMKKPKNQYKISSVYFLWLRGFILPGYLPPYKGVNRGIRNHL